MTVLLSRDVEGDKTTTKYFDEMAGKVHVKVEQDCTPYVERAKKLAIDANGAFNKKQDMYYAGSIPHVLIEKYCREKGMDFATWMREGYKRMLNDPDYSNLRIWKGQL